MIKPGKQIYAVILLLIFCVPQFTLAFSAPGIPGLPTFPTVPTSVPAIEAKETGIKIFGINTGISWDEIAINIAKRVIERIVDSTVTWINNGFDGNPAFVTDPKSYFTDIADEVAGEYIEGSDLSFLCSPFQQSIKASLIINHNRRQGRDRKASSCSITSIRGNIEDFYSDFSNGGWDAWFEITQNDSNNPYGVYLQTQFELDRLKAAKLVEEEGILDWGNGFRSFKDENGLIKTPGGIIEGQLQKTLGTNLTQLELADEFDELIGALLGQLLSQTVFSQRGLITNSGSNSFPVSGGTNTPGGGNDNPEPTTEVSCFAQKTEASINEEVRWFAISTFSGTVRYQWSSTGSEDLSTLDPQITYSYSSEGTKNTSLTIYPSANSNLSPMTVNCENSVQVTEFSPISVACFPSTNSAAPNTNVSWVAQISGGSGEFENIQWSGSQEFVPGTNGQINKIFPIGLSPTENQIMTARNTTTVIRTYEDATSNSHITSEVITKDTSDPTIPRSNVVLERKYFSEEENLESMVAKISVVDKNPLTKPIVEQQCTGSIFIDEE